MSSLVLAFDLYGTLIDPLAINRHVRDFVAAIDADAFVKFWREKQIEYAFRKTSMRCYENFDVCTQQALRYAAAAVGASISPQTEAELLARYLLLPAFDDALSGLSQLKSKGHAMVVFTNGVEATARAALTNCGAMSYLDAVISVDDVRAFKPSPEVYAYLGSRVKKDASDICLISSNTWDVIGAKAAGLRAAWVKRSDAQLFDPWSVEPDLVVRDLNELAHRL